MRFSPLKKKVKIYNNRQQIHLNKSDEYDDEYAWIYSPKEMNDLMSEMESLRIKIDDLKQSDNDKADIIKDYQSRYKESLDEVRHEVHQEYQDEINQLKSEISQLKDDHQDEVNKLNQEIKEHQVLIKDYQSMIKDYEDSQSNHKKEIDDHKAVIYDISTKYNNLRTAIMTTSRLDVFLNRHKRLLNDYPEMTLSSNYKVIDTKSTDDKS